ncbi:MAG: NlpC/P60 family protein [Bdellovibrionaceae bacterium]|nr:NlpC/P60 family protein [Pseudobdellovibrionaceae bacterium]
MRRPSAWMLLSAIILFATWRHAQAFPLVPPGTSGFDLGRSGCFGSSHLPMGSASQVGAYFDSYVNCYPTLTSEPWMMPGAGDGLYYPSYPWAPETPHYPLSGVSPYYYHERRTRDDELSSASGAYSMSYHSVSLSRSSSGRVPAWDATVNRRPIPATAAAKTAQQPPQAQGTSAQGAAATDGGDAFPPLVIEPVSPKDASLVFPSNGKVLPRALEAHPQRAALAKVQPASDAPVRVARASGPRAAGVDGAVGGASTATPKSVAAPTTKAAAVVAIGGRKPKPPISPSGQLALPVPAHAPTNRVARKASDATSQAESQKSPRPNAPDSKPEGKDKTHPADQVIEITITPADPMHAPSPENQVVFVDADQDKESVAPVEERSFGDLPPAPSMNSELENASSEVNREAVAGAEACVGDCQTPTERVPTQDFERFVNVLAENPPSVAGARKIMTTLYQSCDAANRRLPLGFRMSGSTVPEDGVQSHKQNPNLYFTPSVAAESHYYIEPRPRNALCRDMKKTLPVFHPCGKAAIRYTGGKLEINPFNNKTNLSGGNLTTMDCSGFIAAAMAASGLKLRQSNKASEAYQLGTSELIRLGTRQNDCMKPAQFSAESSIKPGDVFVLHQGGAGLYGHAMMFENVGPDPFALNGISSASQCNGRYINPQAWEFSVIHSSGAAGRMAITRLTAQGIVADSQILKNWVMELAIEACYAKFKTNGAEAVVAFPLRNGRVQRGVSLLRHVGPSVSACVEEKPVKIVGEECVRDCKESKP